MSNYDRELTERARAIKRKKKRRKVIIARLITLLIIVALIAGGVLVVKKLLGNDGYDDQSSFEKYANTYYDSFDGDKQIGESRAIYKFGEPVSTAVDRPKLNQESENLSITDFLKGKADSFKVENQSLGQEEQAALLIGYESYETPEKAESVAMHERQIFNAGTDKQKIEVDTVKCFNFSTKNGMTMIPSNMLKSGYEDVVRKMIKEAVDDKYKDNVKDLDVSNFIMTDEGFRFFADGGVLAPKEEGVQRFDISCSTRLARTSSTRRSRWSRSLLMTARTRISLPFRLILMKRIMQSAHSSNSVRMLQVLRERISCSRENSRSAARSAPTHGATRTSSLFPMHRSNKKQTRANQRSKKPVAKSRQYSAHRTETVTIIYPRSSNCRALTGQLIHSTGRH